MMSFSFIGADDLDALQLPPDDERRSGIRVANPLRDEEGVMRTTLLPGLLKAAAVNVARKTSDVSLFETGKVFLNGGGKDPRPAGTHGIRSRRPAIRGLGKRATRGQHPVTQQVSGAS